MKDEAARRALVTFIIGRLILEALASDDVKEALGEVNMISKEILIALTDGGSNETIIDPSDQLSGMCYNISRYRIASQMGHHWFGNLFDLAVRKEQS